jgi:predicted DNA-binding WGR domain protein
MFQVLRNKTDKSKHYVFYRYGRVGLPGEFVLRGVFSEEKAIELFRQKEEEQEKRGKYTALDINYHKNGKVKRI